MMFVLRNTSFVLFSQPTSSACTFYRGTRALLCNVNLKLKITLRYTVLFGRHRSSFVEKQKRCHGSP